MEPAGGGKLQVQDRARRQETQKPGMDPDRAQDLARQENIDRESRPLVTTKHQPAHHRRNDEVDERVPRVVAAEVEPMRAEKQRERVNRRTRQQRDGQHPQTDWSSHLRDFGFHRLSVRHASSSRGRVVFSSTVSIFALERSWNRVCRC